MLNKLSDILRILPLGKLFNSVCKSSLVSLIRFPTYLFFLYNLLERKLLSKSTCEHWYGLYNTSEHRILPGSCKLAWSVSLMLSNVLLQDPFQSSNPLSVLHLKPSVTCLTYIFFHISSSYIYAYIILDVWDKSSLTLYRQ